MQYIKLDDKEIQSRLTSLKDWSVVEGKLTKTFKFQAYPDGAEFALKVAREAEFLNHHPDILIGYCNVTISVNTHDVGGLSPFDFELARVIDLI